MRNSIGPPSGSGRHHPSTREPSRNRQRRRRERSRPTRTDAGAHLGMIGDLRRMLSTPGDCTWDTVQPIANEGCPLCITETKRLSIGRSNKSTLLKAAGMFRNQVREGRGYLRGMEGRTIDGAIRWATRGGGKVYSVERKGIKWITNVKQVAEEIQRASKRPRDGLREAVRK